MRFLSACAFSWDESASAFSWERVQQCVDECECALCVVWTSANVRCALIPRTCKSALCSVCWTSASASRAFVVVCWTSSSASRAFGLDGRERVRRVFLSYDGLVRVRRAFDFVGRVRVRRTVHFLRRVPCAVFFFFWLNDGA